jgi:hypothetical protein
MVIGFSFAIAMLYVAQGNYKGIILCSFNIGIYQHLLTELKPKKDATDHSDQSEY